MNLFVFRGSNQSKLSHISLNDLLFNKQCIIKKCVNEVIIIQRCERCQLYLISGLQKSIHFALGSVSSKHLIQSFKQLKIKHTQHKNKVQMNNKNDLMLWNTLQHNQNSIEQGYMTQMKCLAKSILPQLLLSTSSSSCERTKFVLNFGFTDLKVHQEKRVSATGQRDISLVALNTKEKCVGVDAATDLGNLLLFVSNKILPMFGLKERFESDNSLYKDYLKLFAKQLNIVEENDLNNFLIPAASIIINNKLSPHTDTSNPIDIREDNTIALTYIIDINEVNDLLQNNIIDQFPNGIPFCVVMYKRQCLNKRISRVTDRNTIYLSTEHPSYEGRKILVDLLSYSLYSDYDYLGRFFSKHRYQLINDKFVHNKDSLFEYKMAIFNEAGDKMAFWSSLLHIWFMYMYKYGINRDDTLSFVLFFCHQCNTTEKICQALLNILKDEDFYKKKTYTSLYTSLMQYCIEFHTNKNVKTDVGSGGHFTRFLVSFNHLYEEDEVKQHLVYMNICFSECKLKNSV